MTISEIKNHCDLVGNDFEVLASFFFGGMELIKVTDPQGNSYEEHFFDTKG